MAPATAHEQNWVRRSAYRVRQFLRGLRATISPGERAEAHRLLKPACAALFDAQPADAQRHSLNVLATLRSDGAPVPADLATAALLHDVGKTAAGQARKGRGIGLWARGLLVLLDALAPSIATNLARSTPDAGWRYLIHVQHAHPALGAGMVRQAGGSSLTCWLIENHQSPDAAGTPEQMELLRRLQWADNRN